MRERFRRLPRFHVPQKRGEMLLAVVLLLSTGVFAEYKFQVVQKLGDSAEATAKSIDNNTYPLRKSISNGVHRVGIWADPGPAR